MPTFAKDGFTKKIQTIPFEMSDSFSRFSEGRSGILERAPLVEVVVNTNT